MALLKALLAWKIRWVVARVINDDDDELIANIQFLDYQDYLVFEFRYLNTIRIVEAEY